jgi:hypothetical protein
LFWKLREPIHANGNIEQLEAANKRVMQDFGADKCWSIEHIMRLPGTTNWPNAKKLAKGRQPVEAEVVDFDEARAYDLADFPTRRAEPATPVVTESAVDESADLFRRVLRDVRQGKRDHEIRTLQMNHPHVVKFAEREERMRRVDMCIAKARAMPKGAEAGAEATRQAAPERHPIDWLALRDKSPPERDWVISNWFPANSVCLLAGKGGIGKTLLAQHLATSIVMGREFIARVPKPRRVLMWAGEDDHDELWRRQVRINSLFDATPESLESLVLHSYAGADITLAAPVFGQLAPTPMMEELRAQVQDYRADVVIIDNVARVFGGNENERHAVTTFIAWLQGVCAPAAVMLLSHPAKGVGSEYSGSTAWEGAVRTRLFMSDARPGQVRDADDGEIADDKARYISRRKANYSPLDCRRLDLEGGLLVPEPVDFAGPETAPDEREVRAAVRHAMERLADMKLHVALGSRSDAYLPKLAEQYRLLGRVTRKQFARAVDRMVADKEIEQRETAAYGNRTKRLGLVLRDQVHK